jgi:peroxiredoxin
MRPGAVFLFAGILLAGAAPVSSWNPKEGAELIGTPAPEWRGITWIQGGPLKLSDLRGKVVLLRFWLGDCPYCERSAPALRALDREFRDRGLVVVGLHHPKSEAARDLRWVARRAAELGFEFPVGQDPEWTTIRAYGVGTHFHRFTSVSFLIDSEGTIRFVHDGGEFHPGGGPGHEECRAAYDAIHEEIRNLLSRPGGSARPGSGG